MNDNSFDYIIVGAGLAGLYAAYHAANFGSVALVTKTSLEVSNSYLAQGGIAAVLGNDDSPEFHIEDTIRTGRDLCNHEAVNILINQGRAIVQTLIEMGMPFDLVDGKISFGLEGGHSKRRVLHAGNGSTGKEMVEFLIPFVLKKNNITVFENACVYKLIAGNNSCLGVQCHNLETQNTFSISGGCTIIATGGASAIFARTTNNSWSTGEGIALAYHAGADIESMEFQQFHPTAFFSDNNDPFLISEAVRGEGAFLVNHHGERFLEKHGLNELSPRDVVSMAIFNELKESGKQHVFLKMDHLGEDKIRNRFKMIYEKLLEYNLEITKDWIPVAPAAHYTIGGIKTGLHGETNIKQLYAAGEVASTGVHGANRMASNSLLECLVFAKRAIEHASVIYLPQKHEHQTKELRSNSLYVSEKEHSGTSTTHPKSTKTNFKTPVSGQDQINYDDIRETIGSIMWNDAGIIRDKDSLERALNQLTDIERVVKPTRDGCYPGQVMHIVDVAKMIVMSAFERKESRGCHFRSDYPEKNPQMLGTIIIHKDTCPHLEHLKLISDSSGIVNSDT
jgi:L-aspartate oxidase